MDRVRLIDISRETGFSINTVSLALKGSSRISDETRELIVKTAERLHYVPNNSARFLVTKESRSVGVIVRNFKSPILLEMIGSLEEYLRQNGFHAIIMGSGDDLPQTVDALLAQNVGGMLVYPSLCKSDFEKLHYLRSINVPFVLMSSDGGDYGMDAVYIDRLIGAYKTTAHLASLGHKRIGFVGSDGIKLEGYMKAVEEFDLAREASLAVDSQSRCCQGGYDAFAALLERNSGMTAVFCSVDTYALGAAKCCHDLGLAIPESMAIVGFDNLEEATFARVPLTTVAYDIRAETETAVNLLLGRVREGFQTGKCESIALEPELVVRESSAGGKGIPNPR